MTDDDGKGLAWAAFGQPTAISQGGTEVTLAYDGENARYEKSVATDSGTETVRYLGAAEKLTVNGEASIRRTLALADLTVIDTGGNHAGLLFPIADHLGSSILLGDGDGASAQAMSYSPFGQRMTAGWAGAMSISQALTINQTETDRGYTGQEGLDAVALWDYNARLYDPALGRFLSVDPLIAHPESTQGINPYSYVENNPLNKTDPTGTMSACMAQGVCDSVKIQGMGSIGKGGPAQQQEQQEQQQEKSDASQSKGSDVGSAQGPIAKNPTGDPDKVNDHNYDGKDSDSAGGVRSDGGGAVADPFAPSIPPAPDFSTDKVFANACLTSRCGWFPLSYKPLGGDDTVGKIAGIVNHETRGMSDAPNENQPLFEARVNIAHVRINGIAKWGNQVQDLAKMASPIMRGSDYWPSVAAVQKAVQDNRKFIDPTFGAYFYNMRTPPQAAGMADFQGATVHTVSGPYFSPTPYKYIFTYGDP